jgi:hypothetical protein
MASGVRLAEANIYIWGRHEKILKSSASVVLVNQNVKHLFKAQIKLRFTSAFTSISFFLSISLRHSKSESKRSD